MRSDLRLVLLALAAVVPATTAGQDRYVAGTVESSHHSLFGHTETIRGDVRFRLNHAENGGEHYVLVGGTLTWSASGAANGCPVSGSSTIAVADDGRTATGGLTVVLADSSYVAGAAAGFGAFGARLLVACPDEEPVELPPFWNAVLDVPPDTAYRARRGVLAGTYASAPGRQRFEWRLAWVPPPALELVVTPEGYDDWIPEGDARLQSAPGNAIPIRATLRSSDGGPPNVEAASFRFDLVDVSREPGTAMNWPVRDPTRRADLQITGADDLAAEDEDEGQWAETGPGTTARVVVSAFDFGAFGAVRVTATLADGRRIVGHLDGDPARTLVPLPKRRDGSFVADAWRAGLFEGPDDEDADATPEGDGHAGDGLTLYEEYRGFVQDGDHVRTDPGHKELFVLNSVGRPASPGITLFEALSGVGVWRRLTTADLDTTRRVVNANHDRGPHRVDQHALWIKHMRGDRGRAVGPTNGTPRHTHYIQLAATEWTRRRSGGRFVLTDAFAAQVAHELLHGVGVWHHGDRDRSDAPWTLATNPDGTLAVGADGALVVLERGQPVHVRDEDGTPRVPVEAFAFGPTGAPLATPIHVGMPHGQHSGHEDCVMRYDVARAYAPSAASDVRFWIGGGDELTGIGLCRARTGTGVNAAGRSPRPRYGDADPAAGRGRPDRGACARQVCVNDAHTHF